jgi:hypothetical protein
VDVQHASSLPGVSCVGCGPDRARRPRRLGPGAGAGGPANPASVS